MMKKAELRNTILDTAMQLAETISWESLHLHDIAAELNISLEQIRQCYPQKDDLVEAWYDRADARALQATEEPEFLRLSMCERLHKIIMAWLDTLAVHKTVSRDMLYYKMEPGHVHLQVLGLLRISRTVQWFREAVQQDSTHLQRIFDEIGLTAIYLMSFVYWMYDNSEHQTHTREFLRHKLEQTESSVHFIQSGFGWLNLVRGKAPGIKPSN
jgi:AcrR family transcriptional regulator